MVDVKRNEFENYIQLEKDNILKIGIKDANGNPTGQHLEFDLESIEYPLKLNECEKRIKKNISGLNFNLELLKKKEDKKGKNMLSWKEEEEIKIWQEFYKRTMEAYDLFFGKDGCKKLLNGREPYYTMLNEFDKIAQSILPMLKTNSEDIKKQIRTKYATKDESVLE